MSQVTVSFEGVNFNQTVDYIAHYKINELDESHRSDIPAFLVLEIKKLIDGDLDLWGNKDFRFFNRLCHHPIQGVACLYVVGDEPKEPVHSFQVTVRNKEFKGNIVACLYTYLA